MTIIGNLNLTGLILMEVGARLILEIDSVSGLGTLYSASVDAAPDGPIGHVQPDQVEKLLEELNEAALMVVLVSIEQNAVTLRLDDDFQKGANHEDVRESSRSNLGD